METPVLSKKQQKASLSARKTKTKETIKNSLASPFNKYWPLVSAEDETAEEKLLKKYLPRIKNEKINVPWHELKNVPKQDRKKFREEYTKRNSKSEVDSNNCAGLILGINKVTEALENQSAGAVLITGDVQPRLMVEHLVDQAVLYGVPVLVLPLLRKILKNHCGISSVTMAIKSNVEPHSKLWLLLQGIKSVYKNYPVPSNHINFDRAKNCEIVSVDNDLKEEIKKITNVKIQEIKKKAKFNEEILNKIYLKRESKDKRVFVPGKSTEVVKNNKIEVDSTGFLAFGTETKVKETVNKTEKVYKSLKLKRLRGDPNRNKRKIEQIKRKR